MISPVWVCVTFLSGVFGNVLITSAWNSPRDSVQDSVLFKLIMKSQSAVWKGARHGPSALGASMLCTCR